MKIGFPLGLSKGGPSIFLERLKNSYKINNLVKTSFFFDPTADLLIFSSKVRNLWGKPHIMRLDGIYYGSHTNSTQESKIKNTPIIEGIKNAKGLVYQSKFSKFLINNFFSVDANIPSTIINNGVDLEKFNPKGYNLREKLGIKSSELVFITSANFRPLKRLDDMINSFIEYKRIVNKKIYLIIIGNLNKKYNNLPKEIIFTGTIKHILLPNWYRTADICLHFAIRENCPNSVVEALATRLPVLCTNLGEGTEELIKLTHGGIVVDADKKSDLEKYNKLNPPSPDQKKIIEGIDTIVKNKNKISENINTKLIDINFVSQKYYDFIKKLEL